MFSNGLVTPAVLGPWLQFTLQGLVASITTNEALPFKTFIVLVLAGHVCICYGYYHWLDY